jgi:hypothetical protein
MRPLTVSEKRTIRFAAIGLGAYLVLFGGFKAWNFLAKQRADYLRLAAEAQSLKAESKTYPDKVATVKKLMEDFHLDPAKLVKNSVVAEASAAIQKAALSGGLKPGAVRESPGRSANKELATIQFEATGQVASVMSLLHQLPLLGYPVVIDSVQISADAMRPGQLKLALTILVLDYEQWKKAEAPHA